MNRAKIHPIGFFKPSGLWGTHTPKAHKDHMRAFLKPSVGLDPLLENFQSLFPTTPQPYVESSLEYTF